MARKASDLAARLRAAVEKEGLDRTAEEEARLARLKAAERARSNLFDELAAFGEEAGFLGVERGPGVTFRFGERFLSFEPLEGDDGVQVTFSEQQAGVRHQLYREAALDDRWIWVRRHKKKEDRVPLFDHGLEVLLVHALNLPNPSEDEAKAGVSPAPGQQSGADLGSEAPFDGSGGKKRSL